MKQFQINKPSIYINQQDITDIIKDAVNSAGHKAIKVNLEFDENQTGRTTVSAIVEIDFPQTKLK